jgi:TolB protein
MTQQHDRAPHGRRLSLAAVGLTIATFLTPAAMSAQGAPFVGCPTWTADGSGLIYCSGSDGYAEIFEITPEGSVRQLTFVGGQASSPAVSPDGALLVFEATRSDQTAPQIYVIPREGQRARTVLVGYSSVDIPGERAVMLTSDGANYDPTFQPDGSRIDFTSDRAGIPGLWSMNVDGTDQSELHLASVAE